jgi:hypothetical protein
MIKSVAFPPFAAGLRACLQTCRNEVGQVDQHFKVERFNFTAVYIKYREYADGDPFA